MIVNESFLVAVRTTRKLELNNVVKAFKFSKNLFLHLKDMSGKQNIKQ